MPDEVIAVLVQNGGGARARPCFLLQDVLLIVP
jgi:hypothetical protein